MYELIKYITIKICDGCNFDCKYCFEAHSKRQQTTVLKDIDKIKRFILTLPLADEVLISLIGGEVGLYYDLTISIAKELKKIERYKDTTIKFCITTNGTNIDKFLGYRKLFSYDDFRISWDGIHAADIAQVSTNEQIAKCIRDIGSSNYKDNILITIAITNDSIDTLADSFEYAIQHGCTKFNYYFIFNDEFDKEYMTKEFQYRFITQLNRIYELYDKYHFTFEDINMLSYKYFINPSYSYRHKCKFLDNLLVINSDENIYPCLMLEETNTLSNHYCLGNLTEGLNKDSIKKFESMYNNILTTNHKVCESCSNKSVCIECPIEEYHRIQITNDCIVRKKYHNIEERIFKENIDIVRKNLDYYKMKKKMDYLVRENL